MSQNNKVFLQNRYFYLFIIKSSILVYIKLNKIGDLEGTRTLDLQRDRLAF